MKQEEALLWQKDELCTQIEETTELIAKANMEWERKILHPASVHFLLYSDAYKEYHTPTLPYPLVKQESILCAKKRKPDSSHEKLKRLRPNWRQLMVNPKFHAQPIKMESELAKATPRYNVCPQSAKRNGSWSSFLSYNTSENMGELQESKNIPSYLAKFSYSTTTTIKQTNQQLNTTWFASVRLPSRTSTQLSIWHASCLWRLVRWS